LNWFGFGFFFQKYWSVIKDQVISEVNKFFDSGIIPEEWNHTHLCLILKVHPPQRMIDLRPISLCSVLYKIVAKILVNRLKKHLSLIVSPTQAAFVSDRMISDNVLIAHEAIHSLKSHPVFSNSSMVVKTDMSKAYDRVEWSFLREMLQLLGFNNIWISWIMGCVTSVTYSILINGQPFGFIRPERGIRQGDPLSPFLFVLCTEALIHLFDQSTRAGSLSGIQFHPSGPVINNLLFADDSLFMCNADKDQSLEMLNCLDKYEKISGQKINKSKSAITFGLKIDEATKKWIKDTTEIQTEGGTGKYLGFPECFSGSKQELLDYIKVRLKDRLTGWFAKNLSQGGKEVLIKSVAMALPVYAMSCFKLPKTSIKNLTSAIMEFWWSNSKDHKKIHWLGTEKMTLPKTLGGFGFKDLEIFNQALLAKQAWRLLHEPNCLFSRFFKSRYFVNSPFIDASVGSKTSYAWRSILSGRDLLIKGLKRIIGNGKETLVWIDKWIHDGINRRPTGIQSLQNIRLRVDALINMETGCWNTNLLRALFHHTDVRIIQASKPVVGRSDFFCWTETRNDIYSIRSGYDLAYKFHHLDQITEATNRPSRTTIVEACWKIPTVPKIQVFLWKLLRGALAVTERLKTKGIQSYDGCWFCDADLETINHMLFLCPYARQVWALSNIPSPQTGFCKSDYENFHYLMSLQSQQKDIAEISKVFPWVLWRLWKNRNQLLFEGSFFPPNELIIKAREDATEWFTAQEARESPMRKPNLSHDFRKPPVQGEFKCNIGYSWSKLHRLAGVSWVLRDSLSNVVLHSRRSYSQVVSLFEAKIKS